MFSVGATTEALLPTQRLTFSELFGFYNPPAYPPKKDIKLTQESNSRADDSSDFTETPALIIIYNCIKILQ